MKHCELARVNKEMLDLAQSIRLRKNAEYSTEEDALANFKNAGKEYAANPQVVLGIFMDKHLASLRTHIRFRQNRETLNATEPFRERVADAINYLLFLDALEQDYLMQVQAAEAKTTGNLTATGVSDV